MPPKTSAIANPGVDFHPWKCLEASVDELPKNTFYLRARYTSRKSEKRKRVSSKSGTRWARYGFPGPWASREEALAHAERFQRMFWGINPLTGAPIKPATKTKASVL